MKLTTKFFLSAGSALVVTGRVSGWNMTQGQDMAAHWPVYALAFACFLVALRIESR